MNTLFYKLIWQNKCEKLKCDLITQDCKEGGIKVINIRNFKTSLKCTWVRTLFLSKSKWVSLSQILQAKILIRYGDNFIIQKCNRMSNMFWKETLTWMAIENKHKPQTVDDILPV